jgi:DNA-binding IclR family transcriptional regulator
VGHEVSGVGVLDKVVVILHACLNGATLADLMELTQLPRATAHRLAQALELHRMLVRDGQGRWYPGPRLVELANAAPDVLLTVARPILIRLRDQVDETAHLYLRRADQRICVAAAERASGLRDAIPVGSARSMTAGAAAQVLLAWEPADVALPFLDRATFTVRTLAEVRQRGWAASVAQREPGLAAVSAPVRDRAGRVVAAISISGPIVRLGRRPGDRYAAAVLHGAQLLSGR